MINNIRKKIASILYKLARSIEPRTQIFSTAAIFVKHPYPPEVTVSSWLNSTGGGQGQHIMCAAVGGGGAKQEEQWPYGAGGGGPVCMADKPHPYGGDISRCGSGGEEQWHYNAGGSGGDRKPFTGARIQTIEKSKKKFRKSKK